MFISIIASRLKKHQQDKARIIGLSLALFGRLALLFSLGWVMSLTTPWFTVLGKDFSGRDLVLGLGGLFLLFKATQEIFHHLEEKGHGPEKITHMSFGSALVQIILLDLVFSLDSIITAIGLVDELIIMAAAVTISVGVMLLFAKRIANFMDENQSMKVLGLAFLLLIAVLLIAECFGHHIPRGYVYFSLAFSTFVELINIKKKKQGLKKTAATK